MDHSLGLAGKVKMRNSEIQSEIGLLDLTRHIGVHSSCSETNFKAIFFNSLIFLDYILRMSHIVLGLAGKVSEDRSNFEHNKKLGILVFILYVLN